MTMYLSAAAAAAASNLPAMIAAGATLGGVALGTISTAWQQSRGSRAASRSGGRQQVQEVTGELIAATTGLQRVLRVVDTRWNAWGPRMKVLGVAGFELLVGAATNDVGKSARRGLRRVADWTDHADAALVAELSAPVARVEAALARAVLLADQAVVNAAVAVNDALAEVTSAYAQPQTLPWGKKAASKAAARAAAEAALQDAVSELIVVARERLHPTPPPRWWVRAARWSRELVPGTRQQPALTATVPAQRAGDDTAPVAPAAPAALPAAPTP
jgi:hypothetical protein